MCKQITKPDFNRFEDYSLNSIRYQNELSKEYHLRNGKDFVAQQLKKKNNLNANIARNTILFLGTLWIFFFLFFFVHFGILRGFLSLYEHFWMNLRGDGMSMPTIAASRVYAKGIETPLSFETFPFVAMAKTYCVDQQIADSACSATGNNNKAVKYLCFSSDADDDDDDRKNDNVLPFFDSLSVRGQGKFRNNRSQCKNQIRWMYCFGEKQSKLREFNSFGRLESRKIHWLSHNDER